MTPQEIAKDFVTRFEEKIKQTLGISTFDKQRAIESITKFIENNPAAEDYYDNITINPRVVTMLITVLHDELIPENIRQERKRIAYLYKTMKQRDQGGIKSDFYNDFLRTFFSGTVNTDDLTKKTGKPDFDSLALKRASEMLTIRK